MSRKEKAVWLTIAVILVGAVLFGPEFKTRSCARKYADQCGATNLAVHVHYPFGWVVRSDFEKVGGKWVRVKETHNPAVIYSR